MIDIYDEMGYIKEVLEHGLSNDSWVKDCSLLAKYYRDEGYKKSEVKKILIEKLDKYSPKGYDKNRTFKLVQKIVNSSFKKDSNGNYIEQIRSIKSVETTKEIIQWFLDLENGYELSDDMVELEKQRRPKVYVKKKPMTFNRIKYLFTLYIWTKIQANYLERPNIHYLKKNTVKFKECADLRKASFSLTNERNFLFDLGFIDINHGIGVIPVFMDKYDVFKIPMNDDNRVVIQGDDLKHCGYWLLKQKMGSFICENCGKEFAHYSLSKQEKTRKYCKDCADFIKNNNKEKFCVDCGKPIEKNSLHKRAVLRCEDCQKKYRREKDVIRKRNSAL